MKNPASQLGKMAAGVPKKFSADEIAKRTARLKTAQKNVRKPSAPCGGLTVINQTR